MILDWELGEHRDKRLARSELRHASAQIRKELENVEVRLVVVQNKRLRALVPCLNIYLDAVDLYLSADE
jgi:hypothetical protein